MTRGGARPGGGRPRTREPGEWRTTSIELTAEQMAWLGEEARQRGASKSAVVRALIDNRQQQETAMRIKHSESGGRWTAQQQGAELGHVGDVITYEVTGIPEGVSMGDVLARAMATAVIRREPWVVDWSELGQGRIVR